MMIPGMVFFVTLLTIMQVWWDESAESYRPSEYNYRVCSIFYRPSKVLILILLKYLKSDFVHFRYHIVKSFSWRFIVVWLMN